MSNYRRLYANGGTYFFTVVTYRRQHFLCDEPCRRWLREAIIYTRQRYPFKIDAWVLLPDHLHCVWTLPENDNDFSIRWNIIKKRFTQAAKSTLHQAEFMNKSKDKHRESTIWQRRFWEHQIRDDDDYRYHIQYTHYNPVKHRLVNNPYDWQYSTIHKYPHNEQTYLTLVTHSG